MADNTTTYKATIDVETKGTDSLTKLNNSLDQTLEGFVDIEETISKTRKALQKAKLDGDKVEFKKLRKELNTLENQLEETTITSSRFTDALAAQPGIVGLVGGSLKGLDGGLKVLAANPIIAVVTLLSGLFLALKESLSKTERGQELLNKAGEAFGKILGPVFALIEKVAFPIFEFFISYLDTIAKGFNKLAKFFGVGTKEIEEASRASSEVLQKKHDEEIQRQEEETKVLEENAKKRIEQSKKEAEERAKIQMDAAKILDDAMLSLMDEQDREKLERERLYQEELKTLKLAGITDLTRFEEEYRTELLAIDEKYRLEKEAKEKELEDARLAKLAEQEAKDDEAAQKLKDAEMMGREDEINRVLSGFALENEYRQKSFDEELRVFQEVRSLERQNLVESGANAKQLQAFDNETATASIQINKAKNEANLAGASQAFGTLSSLIGENSKAGKSLSIAQAVIDTYAGATKALAQGGIFGAIAAAGVIAAGLANVKKIVSTKLPQMPGAKGGGGGSTPSIPSFSPPQIQGIGGGGLNPTSAISETIAQSQNRPIEAYVVSTKMSSQQAVDRRVNTASTFG